MSWLLNQVAYAVFVVLQWLADRCNDLADRAASKLPKDGS